MTPTDWDGWICLFLKANAIMLLVGLDLILLVEALGWLAQKTEERKRK